ncbi:MAG: hypothetical protein R2695_17570 [Acidimicrobiales bacterium]
MAQAEDGRVVFVEGALAGERVVARSSPSTVWSRARVVRVVEASADRGRGPVQPPDRGMRGCDLLHVAATGSSG